MTDAGFFRGTSADQDNRFSDKYKKLLKQLKFSDVLNQKVDIKKVNMDVIKPWIQKHITLSLGLDDEVVYEYVINQLEESRFPDGKNMQINLTGFLDGKRAREFMDKLWQLLVDAQTASDGIPQVLIAEKAEEIKRREENEAIIQQNKSTNGNISSKDRSLSLQKRSRSSSRGRSNRNRSPIRRDDRQSRRSRSRSLEHKRNDRSSSHSRSRSPPSNKRTQDSRSPSRNRSTSKSPGSRQSSVSRSRSRSRSPRHHSPPRIRFGRYPQNRRFGDRGPRSPPIRRRSYSRSPVYRRRGQMSYQRDFGRGRFDQRGRSPSPRYRRQYPRRSGSRDISPRRDHSAQMQMPRENFRRVHRRSMSPRSRSPSKSISPPRRVPRYSHSRSRSPVRQHRLPPSPPPAQNYRYREENVASLKSPANMHSDHR